MKAKRSRRHGDAAASFKHDSDAAARRRKRGVADAREGKSSRLWRKLLQCGRIFEQPCLHLFGQLAFIIAQNRNPHRLPIDAGGTTDDAWVAVVPGAPRGSRHHQGRLRAAGRIARQRHAQHLQKILAREPDGETRSRLMVHRHVLDGRIVPGQLGKELLRVGLPLEILLQRDAG
jgi:hypothetical protein